MSFLLELTKLQRRRSWLTNRELLEVKMILLMVSLFSGILPNPFRIYMSSAILAFSLIALLLIGAGEVLFKLLLLYLALAVVITPFSLMGGASVIYLISINLYTVSTFLMLALFISTTPWEQLEEAFGDNIVIYSYRMLDLSLRDLQRVIESYRARGAEISALRPWKAVPVLTTILYLTASTRIPTLEESLRSRGGLD